MSTVVSLRPPAAQPPPSASHRRLRLGSQALAWLFTILLAGVGLIAAVLIAGVLAYAGENFRIGPTAAWIGKGPPDSVAFASLSLPHRAAYALVGTLRIAPVLMILAHLRALFFLYAAGEVFGAANAPHIGRTGAWLCAYAVSPFVCHLFLAAGGWEIDKRWLHLSSVQALVLGLLVFVIAQVMQVGREIEEDRDAFV